MSALGICTVNKLKQQKTGMKQNNPDDPKSILVVGIRHSSSASICFPPMPLTERGAAGWTHTAAYIERGVTFASLIWITSPCSKVRQSHRSRDSGSYRGCVQVITRGEWKFSKLVPLRKEHFCGS